MSEISCFETAFFVFLHPCPFWLGNHSFFIAKCRRVSPACKWFFFKIVIMRRFFVIIWFPNLGHNCLVSLKLVYDLKITFRPNTLKTRTFRVGLALFCSIRLDLISEYEWTLISRFFFWKICPGLRPQIMLYFIPQSCRRSQKISHPDGKSDIIPEISPWEKCIFDITYRNLNYAAKFDKLNLLVKKLYFGL